MSEYDSALAASPTRAVLPTQGEQRERRDGLGAEDALGYSGDTSGEGRGKVAGCRPPGSFLLMSNAIGR